MPTSPDARVRVLLVDDEADFATAVAERLSRRGFLVRAAFSGRQGISMFEKEPPDVVVVDLKMPEIDGLGVLRRIRAIDPRVPVIILTGHGSVASGIEGMQGGASDFLQKPVSIEILCNAIGAAAERSMAERATSKRGERE